jgi:type II secretory pathway component PulK
MKAEFKRRSGAALFFTIVVLSVLGVTSALAARTFATARRTLALRNNRAQAEWLARSGAEFAVAGLLADEKYAGETVEPIAKGPVKITVAQDPAKADTYRIRCEATFPTDDYRAVRFALTRTATRKTDGNKVTVSFAAGPDAPPAP